MTKVEIDLPNVDYQLIRAMAAYANEAVEEYCRQVTMGAVAWDLEEASSQIKEKFGSCPGLQ